MSKIKIFSLGGLNENGKNMYVVEVNQDIFVFDAGLKYDNDQNLGIDYIIPNFDYVIKNKNNIKGIFLTHGHEGNMGAVPDIIETIPEIPVYGTKLTLEFVERDVDPKLFVFPSVWITSVHPLPTKCLLKNSVSQLPQLWKRSKHTSVHKKKFCA